MAKNKVNGKELEQVIESIKKKTKDPNAIMRLGDSKKKLKDIEVISTGSLALDTAIGIGGVPKGRIVEIYGPESSGKTTLTLHIVLSIDFLSTLYLFVYYSCIHFIFNLFIS